MADSMLARTSAGTLEAPVTDAVFIQQDGRLIPDPPPRSPAPKKVQQLQASAATKQLTTSLQDELWPRFSLPVLAGEQQLNRTTLAREYIASLEQIQQLHDELIQFCHEICRANVEFQQTVGAVRPEQREQIVNAKLDEMLARVRVIEFMVRNSLTAERVAGPVEELFPFLVAELRKALDAFLRHVIDTLHALVSANIVGVIEWVGPSICRYHYFREVILQESNDVHVDIESDNHNHSNRRRRLVASQSGRTIHRRARHEHQLMHAYATTLTNSSVQMPPLVEELARRIPTWLVTHVRVINGDLFRQRIIEQDYRVEQWQEVSAWDVAIFGEDPGIAIGHFILAGWGPDEVAAERQRRGDIQEQHDAENRARRYRRERIRWIGLTGVAIFNAVLFQAIALNNSSVPRWWPVALVIVAAISGAQALVAHYLKERRSRPLRREVGMYIAAMLFMASGMLFVTGLARDAMPSLGGSALVFLLTLIVFRASFPPQISSK